MKPLNVRTASVEEIVEAFEIRRPMVGIVHPGVHAKAHIDEISSFATLRKYGRKMFIGIEKADLRIVTQRWLTEQFEDKNDVTSLAWARALQQGLLLVGTGGGPLDDHVQKAESCLSLITKFLGVDKNPELQKLTTYVNYEDSNGERASLLLGVQENSATLRESIKPFMLGTRIKHTWDEVFEGEVEMFTKYFVREIELVISREKRKLEEAKAILLGVTYVGLPLATTENSETAEIAIVKSDSNLALSIVLEGNNRPNLVAILQIKESGNFQLHTVGKRIKLRDVAHIIRGKILKVKNEKQKLDWKALGNPGSIDSVPEIYYFLGKETQRIFNGSSTQPDTKPTIGVYFTEQQLIDLVIAGLQDRMFDSEHQTPCEGGACPAHTDKAECTLYPFGLGRCRTNRFHLMPKEKETQGVGPQ